MPLILPLPLRPISTQSHFNYAIRKKVKYNFFILGMQVEQQEDCIVIGYFGVRAKAQVCRLLCEYLELPYRDRFFSPEEWENYQKNEAKNWIIKGLPFLKDGDFVVTGQHGIIEYLVRKSGRLSLLGNSVRDRIRLDMFKGKHDIKDNIIGLICQMNRTNCKVSRTPQQSPEFYWEEKILPKLQEIERNCRQNDWYFGYVTVADFSFYEMMNNIEWLFPELISNFPKLMALRNRVYSLDSVHAYETSARSVKIFNPVWFYNNLQQQKRQMQVEAK